MNNADENIRKAASEEAAQLEKVFNATQAAEIEKMCKSMFDLYTNYVKAGFTPGQALQLVIATLQATVQVGKVGGK